MASTGNIRDEYVITARLEDKASAEADALATRLNAVEQAALRDAAAFIQANQAQAAAAASFRAVGGSADQANKAVIGVGISAQSLVRRYDDITRAAVAAETSQRRLAAAQDTLNASPSDAGARALDKLAAIAATAQAKLESLQQTASQMAPAMTNVADAMSEAEKIQQRYAQGLDNLRAKFDPVFAAAQQYETVLTAIADAQSVGAIKAHVASDATERATATYRDAAAAAREQTAALQQQNEAANRQLLGISDPDPQASAKRAQDIEAYGKALDDLRARLSPLFAAQQQYADELALISKAQTTGAGTADEAAAATERAAARYRDAAAAAREQAAALQQQNEAANRQLLGISDPNPQATAARAADIEAYGKALDDLQAKYDPLFAAQRQYKTALEEISTLQKGGAISSNVAAKATSDAEAAYKKVSATTKEYGATAGQTGFAVRQFGVQVTQAVSGIATGQPILQTFIQQGHQMLDVALATGTGFGVIGQAAKAAFTAIGGLSTLVGGTVIGVLVTAGTVYETHARHLLDLQTAIRAVSDNYKEMAASGIAAAKAVALSSTSSTSDLDAAAKTFLTSGNFAGTQAQLENLLRVTTDVAAALGHTIPDEAKAFVAAMQDPARAAQDMADKHLFGMNQELVRTVTRLVNAGDKAGAFAAIFDQVQGKTKNLAKEGLTPLQSLLNDIGTGFRRLGDDITTVINNAIAGFIRLKNAAPKAGGLPNLSFFGGPNLNQSSSRSSLVPTTDPAVVSALPPAAAANGLDLRLLQLLQASEGRLLANGQWQTSASGAVGALQVEPSTFAGMLAQPGKYPTLAGQGTDLSSTSTNVAAGAAQLGYVLRKYGDVTTAILAYHDGETLIDQVLASGGRVSPSQAALDQARKITSQYKGTGFAPRQLNTNDILPGPGTFGAGAGGAVNDVADQSVKLATGTVTQRAQDAADAIKRITAALDQFKAKGDTSSDSVKILNEDLKKAQANAYDAIDPIQGLTRGLDQQTVATRAIADAYKAGYTAIDIATVKAQAQKQVIDSNLKPGMEGYAEAVDTVTAAILKKNQADSAVNVNKIKQGLDEQASGQRAISAAYKEGDAAVAIATARDQARTEVINSGILPGMAGYEEALKGVTTAILQQNSASDDVKVQAYTRGLDQQTAATLELADAYKAGYGAVEIATAKMQAQQQVINFGIKPGMEGYAKAVDSATSAILRKNAADNSVAGEAVFAEQQQQLVFLKAEAQTLGESAEQRARDLATLKQQQEIEKQRPNEIQATKDAEIANAQALASSTFELQNQQNALSEISNIVQSIGDNIAQALTNAFVSGQGAAVSFGNVAKAVMTQVLQEVLKLSVINPILNSITGGTAVTGGDVLSVLGLGGGGGGLGLAAAGLGAFSATGPGSFGSGRGTSGGEALIDGSFAPGGATFESSSRSGGGFGGASNILSAGSGLSKLLGFDIGKELGLTGPNGLFSGVSNILGGGIFGTSAAEANTAGLIAGGFGPGQALGVVNAAPTGILGGVSVGSLLGGIGAGFGVGSLAGGFVQNALGKVGPAPTIGAGLGAAGGAALGSIIPGVGTIIGGLIGGLLGGGGGGLIGPKAPSPFAVGTYLVDPTTGQLKQGAFAQQKENGLPILQQLQGEISGINQVLSGGGARITTTGGKFFIGDDQKNAAIQDRSAITASIADAFSGFRFTGNDQPTSTLLQGRSFGDLNELNQILGTFKNFTASLTAAGHSDLIQKFTDSLGGLTNSAIPAQLDKINQFVVATVPALEAFNKQTGSFADAINNINSQFNPAIQTAHELGYAESDLASARDLAIQKVQEATDRQLQNIGQGYANRYAAAAATISGSPTDALNAQLQSFDLQATNERQGLTDQLVGIFGDSIKTQQFYADEMANLDKTLAEERLAIQKQSNQQLLSQAATLITSLADYTRNLQFSQASPLSPQDQLSLAQKDFNAVSGSALAGDANSLSKLTQYSDTLLNAGRAVYGSGQGYADLFKSVVDTLNKVSEVPIDTLTASIFQMETRTQTTILESAINDLKSEVTALRAQLNTGALTPDRLAA